MLWLFFGGFLSVVAFSVLAAVAGAASAPRKAEELERKPEGEEHPVGTAFRVGQNVGQALRSKVAAKKTCPACAETVKAEAKICRFCRHGFDTGQPPKVA